MTDKALATIDSPNQLRSTADLLEGDGHAALAAQYRARADMADEQIRLVRLIGSRADSLHNAEQRRRGCAAVDTEVYGQALAMEFVALGWIPPRPLAIHDDTTPEDQQ